MTDRPAQSARLAYGAAILVFLASVAAILAALGFEHYGGFKPCPLCLIERYAYYFSIPAALGAFVLLSAGALGIGRWLLVLCAVAYFINAGLGGYHAGIEWQWWPGPAACSGGSALATDAGSLLDSVSKTKVIRCDEAPWRLFSLSFAGYSFLISAGLALVALTGAISARQKLA